jgi:ADP-ribose pyrophosphatase YjhB (NUDIX family)
MKHQLQPWERISTETLFTHRFFTILEDVVRFPNGRPGKWWRFNDGPDFVTIICLNERRQVLVSYQYNNAPQCVVAEFAGGGVEPGESYPEAARRELMEEVGYDAHDSREIGAFLFQNRHSSRKCRVFLATQLEERSATPDEAEFIETEWLDIATLDHRIASGEIDNGIMLAAWCLFKTVWQQGH